MNNAEKRLANKLLSDANPDLTPEDNLILERWEAQGILNKDAFHDGTSVSANHKEYLRGVGYPFTAQGEEERKKHWYLKLRNNIWIVVVRDVATVAAFILSIWLTLAKLAE